MKGKGTEERIWNKKGADSTERKDQRIIIGCPNNPDKEVQVREGLMEGGGC